MNNMELARGERHILETVCDYFDLGLTISKSLISFDCEINELISYCVEVQRCRDLAPIEEDYMDSLILKLEYLEKESD